MVETWRQIERGPESLSAKGDTDYNVCGQCPVFACFPVRPSPSRRLWRTLSEIRWARQTPQKESVGSLKTQGKISERFCPQTLASVDTERSCYPRSAQARAWPGRNVLRL